MNLGTFNGHLSSDTICFGSCVGTFFEEHALCLSSVEGWMFILKPEAVHSSERS
jgi:hypothetical protein